MVSIHDNEMDNEAVTTEVQQLGPIKLEVTAQNCSTCTSVRIIYFYLRELSKIKPPGNCIYVDVHSMPTHKIKGKSMQYMFLETILMITFMHMDVNKQCA